MNSKKIKRALEQIAKKEGVSVETVRRLRRFRLRLGDGLLSRALAHIIFADGAGRVDGSGLALLRTGANDGRGLGLVVIHQRQ